MGYSGQITAERTAEELLLEFERTGRPEPFEEIVRRYSGMVFHVCHRICRDRHDAEDATQAVFAALAVGRKKEGGEIRTIGPWLRQVARRVSLDLRRGKTRRQRREALCATDGSTIDHKPEPAAHKGLDAQEINQLVKEELDKLPVKYRLPLVLHYFGGMSQDDMATELGCRPGTLRVRLHRGRNMLAKRLAKRGVTLGAVALAVAVTRVVHSAVSHSLAFHLGHSSAAATAGGVTGAFQASASAPLAAAHGVAATKFKITCALLLIGACVVRAGAEVYDYIRPLQTQLHLPLPLNFDRLIRPLTDTIPALPRVDATPIKPTPPVPVVPALPLTAFEHPLAALPPQPPVQYTSPSLLQPAPTIPTAVSAPASSVPQRLDYLPARVLAANQNHTTLTSDPSYRPQFPLRTSLASSDWAGSAGTASRAPLPSPAKPRTPRPPSSGSTGGSTNTPSTPTPSDPAPVTPSVPQGPSLAENYPTVPPTGTLTQGIDLHPAPPVTTVARRAITLQPSRATLADVIPPPATTTPPPTPPPSPTPIGNTYISYTSLVGSSLVMDDSSSVGRSLQLSGYVHSYDTTYAAFTAGSTSSLTSQAPQPVTLDPDTLYVTTPTTHDGWYTYQQGHDAAHVRWTTSKLSGHGVMPNGVVLDSSGQVVAAGTDANPVFDLSKAGPLTNPTDNPRNGLNGWYVDPHAKLVLPLVHVARGGTHAYTFGDAPDDETPDLVNSARLTLHDAVAEADADLALLSPDRPDVPALPANAKFIGLWKFDYAGDTPGGVDLLVRYDAAAAITYALAESDLRLWRYAGNGWSQITPLTQDLADHLLSAHADSSLTYFAVGAPLAANGVPPRITSLTSASGTTIVITPEPGSLLTLASGITLLLAARRRKRM